MSNQYDEKSCNALQRPFYRPIEAAIRWCNLTAYEAEILQALGANTTPGIGQFPQWPCLRKNTEEISLAMENGELAFGRDGKPVAAGEHIAPGRRTVRHADLKAWMTANYPANKPSFLFDEVERTTHAAINTEAFIALQAERDSLKSKLERTIERGLAVRAERDALQKEVIELQSQVSRNATEKPLSDRERASLLRIIGGLVELATASGQRWSSQGSLIDEMVENFGADREGISKSGLDAKFAEARRKLHE